MSRAVEPLIRRARRSDGPGVYSLLWAARDDIPLRPEFNNDATKNLITQQCANNHVWLAEADGELAGAMLLKGDEIFYLVVSKVSPQLEAQGPPKQWKRRSAIHPADRPTSRRDDDHLGGGGRPGSRCPPYVGDARRACIMSWMARRRRTLR
jgi:hypothetical protein